MVKLFPGKSNICQNRINHPDLMVILTKLIFIRKKQFTK